MENVKLLVNYLYDINQDFKNIKKKTPASPVKYIIFKNRIIALDKEEYLTQNIANMKFESKKYKDLKDDMYALTKKPLLIEGQQLYKFLSENKANIDSIDFKDDYIQLNVKDLLDFKIYYANKEIDEIKHFYKEVLSHKNDSKIYKTFEKGFLSDYKKDNKNNLTSHFELNFLDSNKSLNIFIDPKYLISVKTSSIASFIVFETDIDSIYKVFLEIDTPLYKVSQIFSVIDYL